MLRAFRVFTAGVLVAGCGSLLFAGGALAVTPGWECVPTTANQPVMSGGTGPTPVCGGGTTAVLAPTFVSSGVGGKPTVQFSTVNVQVVSGSGSTSGTLNGEGNLIVGYAENTKNYSQTGSNNLIVGSDNGWKSYGEIVGGFANQGGGKYATAVGYDNSASGAYSLAAGQQNKAGATASSALGGEHNTASGDLSAIAGGQYNLASDPLSFVGGGCDSVAGTGSPLTGTCPTTGAEAVLGGSTNVASGPFSTVAGGQTDLASGSNSVAAGGEHNISSDPFSMTVAGCDNVAGTVSLNSNACDDGGEAVSGGASVGYSVKDGTGGLVSEIVDESNIPIGLSLNPGVCGSATLSIPPAKLGDQALISFPVSPPPAALEFSPPNVTANGTVLDPVCNVGSTSVSYTGHFSIIVLR
jgi:hypothetical protein